MNAKGLELTQADKILNFILMDLELGKQEELYEDYWLKMEQEFGQEEYRERFDMLISPNSRRIYGLLMVKILSI